MHNRWEGAAHAVHAGMPNVPQRASDDTKMLLATVSFVNAEWISPHNRGNSNALVSVHNEDFLWHKDGATLGFLRIFSGMKGRMVDLIYVPPQFTTADLLADTFYALDFSCPLVGRTVRHQLSNLSARIPNPALRAGATALSHLAGQLVGDALHEFITALRASRGANRTGYVELGTLVPYIDAPVTRDDLVVRTAGELRRAGILRD